MLRHLEEDLPKIQEQLATLHQQIASTIRAVDNLYEHRNLEPDSFKESTYYSEALSEILEVAGSGNRLAEAWRKLHWHTVRDPDDMW